MFTLREEFPIRIQRGVGVLYRGRNILPALSMMGETFLPSIPRNIPIENVDAEKWVVACVRMEETGRGVWNGIVLWDGSRTGALGSRPLQAGRSGPLSEHGVLVFCWPDIVERRRLHARPDDPIAYGVMAMGFRDMRWTCMGYRRLVDFSAGEIDLFTRSMRKEITDDMGRITSRNRSEWMLWLNTQVYEHPMVDVFYKLRVVGAMRLIYTSHQSDSDDNGLLKWGLVSE